MSSLIYRDKILVIRSDGKDAVIWTNDFSEEELAILSREPIREATLEEKEFWYLHSSTEFSVVYLTYFKDWLKMRREKCQDQQE